MKKGKSSIRVLIDTNIWISFLIGKHLSGLVNLLDRNAILIILPQEQLDELIEVLKRPKFSKYFSDLQIEEFLSLLEEKSLLVKPKKFLDLCRDPKDNYILSTAIEFNVDIIVSGDEDLLVLKEIQQTRIVSFKHFQSIVEK